MAESNGLMDSYTTIFRLKASQAVESIMEVLEACSAASSGDLDVDLRKTELKIYHDLLKLASELRPCGSSLEPILRAVLRLHQLIPGSGQQQQRQLVDSLPALVTLLEGAPSIVRLNGIQRSNEMCGGDSG